MHFLLTAQTKNQNKFEVSGIKVKNPPIMNLSLTAQMKKQKKFE